MVVSEYKNRSRNFWSLGRQNHTVKIIIPDKACLYELIIIDYVLARQRDLKDVLHTRLMFNAECHTDHRFVRCKLRMHFKPKPKNRKPLKKNFKLSMLQSAEVKSDSQTNLQAKLGNNSFPEDSSLETH